VGGLSSAIHSGLAQTGRRRPKRSSSCSAACISWPRPAKILNPDKIVVLAGQGRRFCSLEESCPGAGNWPSLAGGRNPNFLDHRLHQLQPPPVKGALRRHRPPAAMPKKIVNLPRAPRTKETCLFRARREISASWVMENKRAAPRRLWKCKLFTRTSNSSANQIEQARAQYPRRQNRRASGEPARKWARSRRQPCVSRPRR